MLESVLAARDSHLKPGGLMIPSRARLWMAPFRDHETYDERVGFWKSSVHGFDMSCLAAAAARELHRRPEVGLLDAECLVADPCLVTNLDLATVPVPAVQRGGADFCFVSHVTSEVHGFVAWFDVELAQGFWLSTAPSAEPTHWQQTLFYLASPWEVVQDQRLSGRVSYEQNVANRRCLDVGLACSIGPASSSARVSSRSSGPSSGRAPLPAPFSVRAAEGLVAEAEAEQAEPSGGLVTVAWTLDTT